MKTIIISIFVCIMLMTGFSHAASYPQKAWELNKSGEVTVRYDVNKYGRAENFKIMKSEPEGFFERSAIEAVKEMNFEINRPEINRETTVKFKR
ncbi:TonB family protein [Erwinia mallotivora]|uniref:TonB family protein n=1 Tax=Erwinia mallotivora TaxID=69222 RepID=UPI0021C0C069|nr:TonB family protein [Erwinia mallotivora]